MIGKRLNRVVQNIMYTDRGRIVLSIILGLGLASLFRKYCKGKNCYEFIGPEQTEVRNKIYSFDSNNSTCYKMKEKNVKCGNKEKLINYT